MRIGHVIRGLLAVCRQILPYPITEGLPVTRNRHGLDKA
jgi:hypothetical protein